mmetsp:Transcript_14535/g.16065  ORF Transcript_14535/g.16065 Transcript_14535/m.16065 type:complete len:102 (-) Transcript_14535:23-328(-)
MAYAKVIILSCVTLAAIYLAFTHHEEPNYYEVLGVSEGSSAKEIKRAYRKQAGRYRPDAAPDNEERREEYRKLSEAYEILGDPETRQAYDKRQLSWRSLEF